MKKANIYIDESGFKSKSKNLTDKSNDDLCVFVGVIVPEDDDEVIASHFKLLFDKFKDNISKEMKLHITDAFASDNGNIRNLAKEVRDGYINIFREKNGKFLFGAKRARIEKKSHDFYNEWLSNIDKNRTNQHLDIKTKHSDTTLEGQAFDSLIGKIEAFAEEYGFHEITPLVDEIDASKEKEYMKILNRFRNVEEEEEIHATAFDKINKKVLKASAKMKLSTEGMKFENRIADIRVIGKDNPLILLADILANYLFYYMKSLPANAPLHAPSSYENCDMQSCIYGLVDGWLDDIV